ncbi:MAG: hypothetical protein N4J56_002120 [Chroococcidiopsis sp. SAG 2025]|uniref:glycosyltransferase family 9 protein n=1 Tax=Chroococcidiopsis sp. SAG 2025 TaxID=171389 RepID=UPI0029370667|nr:hypothetical protein [Chroococcidiopsis sp. SAG 2025]MDV2992466.1 hypothetical protein [Chroococcidiopsis sp. SAG 2025]
MQINWQQVQRLLVIFVADLETELTFLQGELQKIRETSTDAEITLLLPRSQETEKDKGTRKTRETRELFSPNFPDSRLVDRIISHTTTWQAPAREKKLIEKFRQYKFDAAIILTNNNESPYPFAYLAYLAGIPIRVGRSREFGGVLSVNSYQLTVSS